MTTQDDNLHLSVAGGLLDLLHRVQNGEASCLYGARLIEEKADVLYDLLVESRAIILGLYTFHEGIGSDRQPDMGKTRALLARLKEVK